MINLAYPLTTRDAALLLCCREAAIRTYINTGRLAATKVGNRWLIIPESVYALMPLRTVPSSSPLPSRPDPDPNHKPVISEGHGG
jgi:hypothetical protein